MTNLSKLDEAVHQFEDQVELLKQNTKVLTKVSELSTAIEKGVVELNVGNKQFDETKNQIQNSLKVLNDSVGSLEKSNEKYIDLLISSNKTFLRELEDTVSSKLARFSSDIQVTIRQERTQLQEVIQNHIANRFESLESRQQGLFRAQTKQINILKTLLMLLIAISIGISVKLLLK